MKKIFVLDTNVLLHDPNAIFAFEDNEVIIPAVVLEEIDSKKRNVDEIGRNARYVSRMLDSLRQKGRLHDGIMLDNGGVIKVELNHRSFQKLHDAFLEITHDNRIIAVALNYWHEESEKPEPRPVVLVSKDTLVRIKADVLGLTAQDYMSDRLVSASDLYPGHHTMLVEASVIDTFYQQKSLRTDDL